MVNILVTVNIETPHPPILFKNKNHYVPDSHATWCNNMTLSVGNIFLSLTFIDVTNEFHGESGDCADRWFD